jgi:hypothetical protein
MREILYSCAGADQQVGDFRNFVVCAGHSRTKREGWRISLNPVYSKKWPQKVFSLQTMFGLIWSIQWFHGKVCLSQNMLNFDTGNKHPWYHTTFMGATFFFIYISMQLYSKTIEFPIFVLKGNFWFFFFCISSYFNPFSTQGLEL